MNLNPIVFALRHPITVLMGIAGLVVAGVLALTRIPIDIFPQLHLPVIYVAQPYGGMDPAQMEGLITNYYEYHFLYISGIHHVESKNIQGVALMKLVFHPGTDMAQALAEVVSYVNRSRAFMPPGTVPPFLLRFDTGSVPVGYLVLRSATRSIGEIQDQALFRVRPLFASLPGVSAPPPFGGNQRTLVIRVDPDRLHAQGLSVEEVVTALVQGNTISPAGNLRLGDQMPLVPINTLAAGPQELGRIPVRPGSAVYLRDIATLEDSTDIPVGWALADGRRAVYLLVTKRADASTLAVVHAVKTHLPRMQAAVPPDIDVRYEFDQSPYVTRALSGVASEALLGALLTGIMVLLFLHDIRAVLVVVLNIPFALLGAVVALWLTGQTLNLMTLGGLALAVGVLVDEATVEVENIHTQWEHTPNIARAVRRGNQETAVPRLLALLCILAVFLPALFLQGAAQALFLPLALAVGFAMLTSYLLSSTFVPVLSVWLLRRQTAAQQRAGWFSWLRQRYAGLLDRVLRWRWGVLAAYLFLSVLLLAWGNRQLGREIFPNVDTGQFQLRIRAATGTRLRLTEQLAQQALEVIRQSAGPDNVAGSIGYVGLVPSSYPINTIYLWTSGPEEAVLRVALRPGCGVRVEELKERLRQELPPALGAWLRQRLHGQLSPEDIEQRVRGLRLSFEPADIVNTVMSFGSPTPIEIAVSGPRLSEDRAYAERLREKLQQIPSLRDIQFLQNLDYPAVRVDVDRALAGASGLTLEQVARSVVAATSSSRFVVPNFWADPNTGIGYQVQVEIPPPRLDTIARLGLIPLPAAAGHGRLLVQDVARLRRSTVAGEYDRYNMKRLVSLSANIAGEDLGRVAQRVRQVLREVGPPPRGVDVELRGQIPVLEQMFGALAGGRWDEGLTAGLGLTVIVIFLLLAGYFQSLRLALVVLFVTPAGLAGVVLALGLTGTTVNLQSFLGAIMAVGVSTANAILLISFAERARRSGQDALTAARAGGQQRLRPILMTSGAMLAGMFPLALGLGEGGEQAAPLGRAVLGGLSVATLTTLFVLPAVFALFQGSAARQSVSMDPDDPESPYWDPPEGEPPTPAPAVAPGRTPEAKP
jgi:multidrug efflux pump subunit AcrB